MACPRCGGSEHVTIAPGLVECQEVLRFPAGAPPGGAHGPGELFGRCLTRYQVPTADSGLGLCWCYLQALGRCTRCGESVCLDHLRRIDDRVVCVEDYEAEARAERAAHDSDVQSAWEAFTTALEETRRTGPRGAPERTGAHPLTVRTGAGLGMALNAPSAGEITEKEAERLRVGDACPLHRGGACTVRELTTRGRLVKKVTGAACAMPLWDLAVLDRSRQGAERLCVDSRGDLALVIDGEPGAHPLHDITAAFFKGDLALIRSATERLRSLTG
jgi:hypothetical protein